MPLWDRNRAVPNKLIYPAATALGMSVTNTRAERVFNLGGIILKPYRLHNFDKQLSQVS